MGLNMRAIFYIVKFYAKSLFKHRATLLFLLLAALMLIVAFLLSDVNIAVRHKLFEDVLLSSQMFLLHLAAVFYAFDLFSRDRVQGLFVLPLASGVKRELYAISLMGTVIFMVAWLLLLFLGIDSLMLFLLEGTVPAIILWQLMLYLFSAVLLIVLIYCMSQLVAVMNAVIYGLMFFMIGSGLDELYLFAQKMQEDVSVQILAKFLYYVLPNFSHFDIQSLAVNRTFTEWYTVYLFPVLYFVGYTGVLMAIALHQYRKKALSVGN